MSPNTIVKVRSSKSLLRVFSFTLLAAVAFTLLIPQKCPSEIPKGAFDSDPVDELAKLYAQALSCDNAPECRHLAHTLGRFSQEGKLTKENAERLLKAFGNPLHPTETEAGYKWCWQCQDKDCVCAQCCLVLGFDWSTKEYTWPDYAECKRRKADNAGKEDRPIKEKPRTKEPAPSKEEIQRLTEKADKGDAAAQYKLGILYIDGVVKSDKGEKDSLVKAGELLIEAASKGHLEARKLLDKLNIPYKK